MFLHIGAGYSVPLKDIALILDCESKRPEGACGALRTKKTVDSGDTRRSAVVTADAVYYSPAAAGTLRKRLERLLYLDKPVL